MKTVGKRFSKKQISESTEEALYEMKKGGKQVCDGVYSLTSVSAFSEHLQFIRKDCEEYLESQNLPSTLWVWFNKHTKQPLKHKPVELDENETQKPLHAYITQIRNYSHDSFEGLASSAIEKVAYLQKNFKSELSIEIAYELGKIRQQIVTYKIEQTDGAKGTGKSRKKEWATLFVHFLNKKYPNKSFEYVWRNIKNAQQIDISDEYAIEIDGEKIWLLGENQSLTKDSFRTGYYQNKEICNSL